jgi:uncharacterized lipoprotein
MLTLTSLKSYLKDHFNAQVKKVVIGLTIIVLTACSSTAKKMVISPQISEIKSTVYALKSAQVNVIDMRPNRHVVAIHREGEAIELVSAHDHFDSIINGLYKQSLKNNGLLLDESSPNNIELIINSAEVHVYQELMKYKTTSQLSLTAKVTSGDKTLTKNFNNKGKSNGVLSADLAVLERNFNQQISDTITLIINDKEIQQLLK